MYLENDSNSTRGYNLYRLCRRPVLLKGSLSAKSTIQTLYYPNQNTKVRTLSGIKKSNEYKKENRPI